MKQVNIGALMRMTVLAALLGSASFAQDLTETATDDATVEQSTVEENVTDETTSADEGSDETSDVGTDDGSDATDDVGSPDGDETTEGEDEVIVIDDGISIGLWPIDDSDIIMVDPIEYCDDTGCYTAMPMEIYPVTDETDDGWTKTDDDTGNVLECTDDLCVFADIPVDFGGIENPEILYSVTGGGAGPEIDGGFTDVLVDIGIIENPEILYSVPGDDAGLGRDDGAVPVMLEMASSGSGQPALAKGVISADVAEAEVSRSAAADGRVLCLSVPKAARNGRAAFDLCEP